MKLFAPNCSICGKKLKAPKKGMRKYCGPKCVKIAHKLRQRQYVQECKLNE